MAKKTKHLIPPHFQNEICMYVYDLIFISSLRGTKYTSINQSISQSNQNKSQHRKTYNDKKSSNKH